MVKVINWGLGLFTILNFWLEGNMSGSPFNLSREYMRPVHKAVPYHDSYTEVCSDSFLGFEKWTTKQQSLKRQQGILQLTLFRGVGNSECDSMCGNVQYKNITVML